METSINVVLLTFAASFFILYLAFKTFRKTGNLPPGPTPLPVFGNFFQIRNGELVKSLLELSEKYGEVYTIYLGSRPVVVVTGYKTVKEVLVDRGDEFLARGEVPSLDTYYRNYGVVFTSNMERWRELRRFSLTALKDFGMGKRSIEDRIHEESIFMVDELKKTKGSMFDPHQLFNRATGNIISIMMFGQRYEYGDEELTTVLASIYECFVIISSGWGQLYEMYPRIMRLLPGPHQKMLRLLKSLLQFVERRVLDHQKTLDPSNPRYYVDAFLIKMEKEKSDPHTEYHLTNLVCSTLQIFFGGVETSSNTLTYSLLILMKYQDVLKKVHREIDRVIGRDRKPKLVDRNQMPYTDAVIHEIQRFIDLAPMSLPRKTTQNVQFRGYEIPKDTNVFPMLTSVLKDPSCFQYPTEFNPKNFLDQNGAFKKNEAFMPLSAGKRRCLGESLVQMSIFIFFTNVLQNFTLRPSVPTEDIDISPNVTGLSNFPKPYRVSFITR
ncbi:cytochrome P450 2G1-like [Discoglossus pictus]